MGDIRDEIAAFQRMQANLEANHMGRWVLIHDLKLVSVYDSFEDAAADAMTKFGKGPFLIRQVGAPPITLPISVISHCTNAHR